jgi:PASTA domain
MAGQERDDAEAEQPEGAGQPAPPAEAGVSGPAPADPFGPAPHASPGEPHQQAAPGPEQAETARLEPQGGAEPPTPREAGPGGTSVLPPTPGGPSRAPEPPRWAARAQVPTRRVEEYGEDYVTEAPRSPLVPVLVTACVMLLLGVFGVGVWLLLNNRPSPTPSQPPTTTTAATTTTTPPTTTTTTATATTAPALTVPPVVDQEYADAASAIAGLGLEPERVDVFSDSVPAGRVIGTDPGAGSPVVAGQTIKVFVSAGPEPTATPTPTPTPTPAATPS